jgi:2-isopropylmalate synthase
VHLGKEELENTYQEFLEMADRINIIEDKDLKHLVKNHEVAVK